MRDEQPATPALKTENLTGVHLGQRIRELRQTSGRSLTEIAAIIGVSRSAMSQLENGQMQPSVNRLVQIMDALDVPLSAVFESRPVKQSLPAGDSSGNFEEIFGGVSVTKAEQPEEVQLHNNVVYRRLSPYPLNGIEYFESTYPPGTASGGDLLVHRGFEVGNIISGELTFEFEEGSVILSTGDCLSFPAEKPHRVVNRSASVTGIAVWLTIK